MNTYRAIFEKFQREMSLFNPNELILVTYDDKNHNLQFTQLNRTIIASYLSPFFLPKKRFKFGILTQSGYNKLMYNLQQLLGNELIDRLRYIPDLVELGTDWYRHLGPDLPVPEKFISLNYVNVTNKWMVKYLCNRYSNSSKILYKMAKKAGN
jgi:hypothetical protein